PAQETATSGSTYQCTVEGFSYTDGAYKLRALIVDNAGNTYTTSAASTTIDNAAPSNTTPPTISGRAWTGQRLTASTGVWAGTEPFTYTYQWQTCNSSGTSCSNITGATNSTFPLSHSDLGNTLRVIITATNPLGSASSNSAATAVVVESMCTDNWTGASGSTWQTPSNWSTGLVPGVSDIACIESGITVQVTGGTNQTGSLRDEGTLTVSGGTLELANGLETSNVSTLTLSGGTLSLAQQLDVNSSLSSNGSATVSGAGRLVVKTGASGAIDAASCSLLTLAGGVTLVNNGTVTVGLSGGSSGQLDMQEGAQLQNTGTFNADSYAAGCVPG